MSGVLLSGEGVASSAKGARIEVQDGATRVIDGPFAEAKELIAGFAILDVGSLDEAVEHARKFALLVGSDRVDVRKVIEVEDLVLPEQQRLSERPWPSTVTSRSTGGWPPCGGWSRLG